MSTRTKSRPPVIDEHGIEHRHGCQLPGWENSRQATAGWWLVNCAGCGCVRMVRAEAAKNTGGAR